MKENLVEATMLALQGKLKVESYRNGRYVEDDPESKKALLNLIKNHPEDIVPLNHDDFCTVFKYKGYFVELRPETMTDENKGELQMDFVVFENEKDLNTDYELNVCNEYSNILDAKQYWNFVKDCIVNISNR